MINPTPYSRVTFAGMRIGLLGGSFNPAHEGHVAISLHALKRLGLDQIWWLVSPQNPLKPRDGMAGFAKRMRQAEAMSAAHPRIIVTGLERRLGANYTIDTLRILRRRMPETRFIWLMGADNLREIHRWRSWEELFHEVPIAVFRRPMYRAGRKASKAATRFDGAWRDVATARSLAITKTPAWLVLDNRLNNLSATRIRRNLKG